MMPFHRKKLGLGAIVIVLMFCKNTFILLNSSLHYIYDLGQTAA